MNLEAVERDFDTALGPRLLGALLPAKQIARDGIDVFIALFSVFASRRLGRSGQCERSPRRRKLRVIHLL